MQGTIALREPSARDGAEVWRLVRRAGRLDVNTPYCYLMMCDLFRSSCVVAEAGDGRIAGFLSALVLPERPDTLFVWQAAVDPDHRGKRVGKSMLAELVNRSYLVPIRYVEATVSPSNTASRRMF